MKKYLVLLLMLVSLPGMAADKLLTHLDFTYTGAFQTYSTQSNTEAYSGEALGYDAVNNSLFISGHRVSKIGYVAEINIPTPGTQTSKATLPYATYRQGPSTGGYSSTNFWDIADGNVNMTAAGGASCSGDNNGFGGLFVYNGALMASGEQDYQATCQFLSYFKASKTLSTDSFDGWYGINPTNETGWYPRQTSGSMAAVPTVYQTQLGGKVVSTTHGISTPDNVGCFGPALVIFDPDDLGTKNTATANLRGTATWLVGYPAAHPTLGHTGTPTVYYTASDYPRSVVIPSNSRTVVFIGTHGTPGNDCYGNVPPCVDPIITDKGYHNYPYVDYMWLYDIGNADGSNTTGNNVGENGYTSGTKYNTLTAVKLGTTKPWNVIPYEVFAPTGSPFATVVGWSNMAAAAINPTTNTLYISRGVGSAGPIIEVYSITTDNPSPPTSVPTIGVGGFRTW